MTVSKGVTSSTARPALLLDSLPGANRQGREADHSPPFNAEGKNEWSYTPTPPTCTQISLPTYVYLLCCVCIAVFFFTVDAGLLARSQYSEGPATGHLDTGFSLFPCVYKQMLRWFPRFQVATTCFSCSPPDLNLVVNNFIFYMHVK